MKDHNSFPFDEDDFEWEEEKEKEKENDELNFITKRVTDNPILNICYIDFSYSVPQEEIIVDLDNPLTRENETIGQVISPNVFTKNVELSEDFISEDDVKEKSIEKIIELSEINFHGNDVELYQKFKFKLFEYSLNDVRRKLLSRILMGSNTIAMKGRIGPAHYMIISEDNYHRYELSSIENIKPIFHDTKDIVLFRKNSINQPGLVYITNNDKYSLVDIGFYPEKQFLKIKIIENEN